MTVSTKSLPGTSEVTASLHASSEAISDESDAKLEMQFAKGTRVLVADEVGVWVVAGQNKDGSITCYPFGRRGGARAFFPEWCVPAEKTGRGGKKVAVRHVPVEMRRARAEWRIEHGFPPVRGASGKQAGDNDG